MKFIRTVSILISLFAVSCLYFLSFKSAYMRASPDDSAQDQIVVLGIKLPYSPQLGLLFSRFYAPLLNYYASKQPQVEVAGTIQAIDLTKLELIISRPTGEGILLRIPPKMVPSVKPFAEGTAVRAIYQYRPAKENPFVLLHVLKSITLSS